MKRSSRSATASTRSTTVSHRHDRHRGWLRYYGCELFALAYVRHVNDNGKDLQLTYTSRSSSWRWPPA
jgi:hypothetical protein